MDDKNSDIKENLDNSEKRDLEQEEITSKPEKLVNKESQPMKEIAPKTEAEKKKYKTGFCVIFVIFLVFYTTLLFSIQGEMKQRTLNSDFGLKNSKQNRTVAVDMRVLSVDLEHNKFVCHVSMYPSSALTSNGVQANTKILANLGHFSKVFSENSTMSSIEVIFPILTGSTNYYPFDKFTSEIKVEFIDAISNSPIYSFLTVKANVPSISFDIIQSVKGQYLKEDTTSVQLNLVISRPVTVIVFSLCIIIIMWALSLLAVSVAWSFLTLNQVRPGSSYLTVGSSLIFALPNLRNVQPGVPPIGIFIDAVGFFWNMVLIALSSTIISIIWIYRRHQLKAFG